MILLNHSFMHFVIRSSLYFPSVYLSVSFGYVSSYILQIWKKCFPCTCNRHSHVQDRKVKGHRSRSHCHRILKSAMGYHWQEQCGVNSVTAGISQGAIQQNQCLGFPKRVLWSASGYCYETESSSMWRGQYVVADIPTFSSSIYFFLSSDWNRRRKY